VSFTPIYFTLLLKGQTNLSP